MLAVFDGRERIKGVLELLSKSLPYDQIEHMSNVGILMHQFMGKICSEQLGESCSEHCGLFRCAAFYHDIGKIRIPSEILTKPGALTERELEIIRGHTLYALELFQRVQIQVFSGKPCYLLSLCRDAAVYHHEYWNGKGYPFGIKEREIPLIARATAICDAYDAMTSDRSYRSAHSHTYACGELEKNAGTQFDPELTKIFLKFEAAFGEKC